MESEADLSNRNLVRLTVVLEGSLALLAVGIGWLIGFPPLRLVTLDGWAVLWGSLAALPMLGALLLTERVPFWPFSDIADVVDQLIRPLFAKATILDLVVISTLAGIGEELLFRGLIQEGLAQRIGGPVGTWVALALASILFGLLHPMNWAYVLLATVMGCLLGGLWIYTGNLLVPIATHAVYDFLALLWLVKRQRPIADMAAEELDHQE